MTVGTVMKQFALPAGIVAGGVALGLVANATHRAPEQVTESHTWADGTTTQRTRDTSNGWTTSSERFGSDLFSGSGMIGGPAPLVSAVIATGGFALRGAHRPVAGNALIGLGVAVAAASLITLADRT